MVGTRQHSPNQLLYLTDEQLLQGIELMFFAYRGFTSDPDLILTEHGYGRAHHRVLHFVRRREGLTVNALLDFLGVSKQSLNRVLRLLIEDGMVTQTIGETDRRQRHLELTPAGREFEARLANVQRARVRRAFQAAGPEAVAGFRKVLENMLDEDQIAQALALRNEKKS